MPNPYKGDRDAFLVRPRRELGDRIRRNAANLGMSYNDYLMAKLEGAIPSDEPQMQQEELALRSSA